MQQIQSNGACLMPLQRIGDNALTLDSSSYLLSKKVVSFQKDLLIYELSARIKQCKVE